MMTALLQKLFYFFYGHTFPEEVHRLRRVLEDFEKRDPGVNLVESASISCDVCGRQLPVRS